jgi:MFS transporter, SP family, sugar:H+ symporter
LGSATNWIWNFLLSFFAPRIAARIGPLILLIFFGCLIFGFFSVLLFVPEVKGLSLEEVDELYRAKVKPWNSSGWKPSSKVVYATHGGRRVVGGEIVEDTLEKQEMATTAPVGDAVSDEKAW